ncbi:MAG: selenocysteine-specific translation elongation factor [Solirubrobacteraceae bacterium]
MTLGTAGHIDHGKTALVGALTGRDTDRLPEEKARGISIALGYAPLELPSGQRVSVVDVPGHERFVRTMVAGATGIDFFLMTIAADDGVMPQTREHSAVLEALGVTEGVVAITKSDLADPEGVKSFLATPGSGVGNQDLTPVVAVSVKTGEGLDELRAALDRVAARVRSRADRDAPARLHVDRSFTIKGAGTVVTGTLWTGSLARGDELVVLPEGREVRVRGVQVHDEPADRAPAGQRVAVNLVGVGRYEVGRGDVLAGRGAGLEPTFRLDVELNFRPEHGDRVQVHHGTREAPARLAELGGRFWQLRLEQPLVAAQGDRIVVRSVAPPDTLGGGTVLDPHPRRHGPSRDTIVRLERRSRGEPDPPPEPAPKPPTPSAQRPTPLFPEALALEERLRESGFEPPLNPELDEHALAALREAGRAVRVGRQLHYHPERLAEIERRVRARIERDGSITLAQLRDELGTSRKFAQALLEHFDATRVTLRRPDDTRVLRRRG